MWNDPPFLEYCKLLPSRHFLTKKGIRDTEVMTSFSETDGATSSASTCDFTIYDGGIPVFSVRMKKTALLLLIIYV